MPADYTYPKDGAEPEVEGDTAPEMDDPRFAVLTPEDIGDIPWIEADIRPRLTQDELLVSQLAQAMRQAGPDGVPLMADTDIVKSVLKQPHPEEIRGRAKLQAFEGRSPDVAAIKDAALLQMWKEENPTLVQAWETANTQDAKFEAFKAALTPESFQQIVKAAAQAEMAKAQGIDPQQLVAQAQAEGQQMQAAQQRQALVPKTAQPYQGEPEGAEGGGPDPSVLPTQMGGAMSEAPQPLEATPEILATQARRRKAQP